MKRENIDIKKLYINPLSFWKDKCLLLCAGDLEKGDYNAMTVAWGSMGVMWHKPFTQIVVRPGRYTYEFMEKYPDWTVSVLPESYRSDITLMGLKSGREMDKIAESGLTLCGSAKIGAPAFEEAELILECRTMFRDVMKPESFVDQSLDKNYPQKDYHIIYYGEILNAQGTDDYSS
ncbi:MULTISPECIES: flavin reductase family protein [unclassified Oceanispirochaeta]|uniref:flavin reductase family protein n=1 Tax=unclassified Oceanispirochaeta TaxID=2635722 RepID=UPI000E091379|nr:MULTISPECIES: flavin reductase [unclassified Oceanispirochaeta]MBF9015936.1 flavin reductase [Oceanispirochaeta sp. M2]NPD72399.1 flavin reductase family protein [Oceanispirochaeta sp. M1]RDG32170.1 flavin reductase family protein [Oceanispirochaeta sp. M1]